jgi:hypothetical protein
MRIILKCLSQRLLRFSQKVAEDPKVCMKSFTELHFIYLCSGEGML